MPGHTLMVQGELGISGIETISASGICLSGINALKYIYYGIKAGDLTKAVSCGSEASSPILCARNFTEESNHQLEELEKNAGIAFEKDFLRWMLSDGAGAFLLEGEPKGKQPLKVEWIEGYSYAHELDTCMYAGGDKLENGQLKPWSEFPAHDWSEQSLFAMKQDVKLLSENILVKGVDSLKHALDKHNIKPEDLTYYLPHISSYFFKDKLYEEMVKQDFVVPLDKWFMNLEKVGNVGAASIYIMLEELVDSGKLNKGDKILLHVPESARFAYNYALLTVC